MQPISLAPYGRSWYRLSLPLPSISVSQIPFSSHSVCTITMSMPGKPRRTWRIAGMLPTEAQPTTQPSRCCTGRTPRAAVVAASASLAHGGVPRPDAAARPSSRPCCPPSTRSRARGECRCETRRPSWPYRFSALWDGSVPGRLAGGSPHLPATIPMRLRGSWVLRSWGTYLLLHISGRRCKIQGL